MDEACDRDADGRHSTMAPANSSQSSLWFLAERGDAFALETLAAQNEDPNRRYTAKGTAVLHLAARHGHSAIIRTLLRRKGTDPNVVQASDGMTPLHFAAMYGHCKAIRILLADNRVTLHQRRFDGKDAIDVAVNFDNEAALDELMSAAATRHESPLH